MFPGTAILKIEPEGMEIGLCAFSAGRPNASRVTSVGQVLSELLREVDYHSTIDGIIQQLRNLSSDDFV